MFNMNRHFLYEMLETEAVSGYERALQNKIIRHMKDTCHQIRTDEIDDVVCVQNPEHPVRVLMAAHSDEIGLLVTDITEDGFLTVTKTGGIYCGTYPGQKVRVLGSGETYYGSVVHHSELADKQKLTTGDLLIDIGVSTREEAAEKVSPGDFAVFDTGYRELLGSRLTARGLDDRIGIFCIMEAMKRAGEMGCKIGVYAASTVGEETSKNGACWVSRRIKPSMAIVVDVTGTSDYRGTKSSEGGSVRLGKGPALLHHPLSHKTINGLLLKTAAENKIPVQFEVGAGRTCTDADQIHFSNEGIPVAVLSIPLRYMHTPGEVCDMADVENGIQLLAEFLCREELSLFTGHWTNPEEYDKLNQFE